MSKLKKTRVTLYVELDVLAVLGAGPNTAGINESLAEYARLIRLATDALGDRLDRSEWTYVAHCLGVAPRQLDTGSIAPERLLVYFAEASKDDLGATLHLASLGGSPGLDRLLAKLRALTGLEARAVMLAVRYYWSAASIDVDAECWWECDHRVRGSLLSAYAVGE